VSPRQAPTPQVTAYAETGALYYLITGQTDETRRVIAEMLPGERTEYASQLTMLLDLLGQPCSGCGDMTPGDQRYVPINLAVKLRTAPGYLCRRCGVDKASPDPAERSRAVTASLRNDHLVSPDQVRCAFPQCPHQVKATGTVHPWKLARSEGWELAHPDLTESTDLRCPREHRLDGTPIEPKEDQGE
jgi:hypothetical protein